MNAKLIDEINARLQALLQQSPAADVQKNLKAMLSSTFSRLDLVTREEFDIQAKVLERTREKLTSLETRLAELETRERA